MEPVGLAFSTIALASLFSTCLECFEYFEAGQAIEEDFELLLVKLDVQKERLSTWGDLVGVHKAKEDGHHPMLDEKEDIVRRCMTSLQKLCTDTSKLQDSYGVSIEPNNSIAEVPEESRSSRLSIFKRSYARIRNTSKNSKPSLREKTKWAIRDKRKFETLPTL